MENLNELKKLAQVFNTDNIITPDEVQQVFSAVLSIMTAFKKDNQQLNEETKQTVDKIISQYDALVSQVTDIKDELRNEISQELQNHAKDLKQLAEDLQSMLPEDGKDADEQKIIDEVLSRIELPQYKEVILDNADQIKTKLETLTGDNRLDISAIKGTDKLTTDEKLNTAISILDKRTQFVLNKSVKHDSTLSGSGTDADPLSVVGGGGSGAWGSITGTLSSQTDLQSALNTKQDTLVSGTNIKTVNENSLVGSGDVNINTPALAFSFNGTSDKVEIPDSADFSVPTTGELSISFWVRPDVINFPTTEDGGADGLYIELLGKGDYAAQNTIEWLFRLYNANSTTRSSRFSFYVFQHNVSLGIGSYFQEPITAGQLIHVVGTVDATYTRIYKNGVLKDTDDHTSLTLTNDTAPVRIGTVTDTSFFQGVIGDIRIYNKKLSDAEALQLYQGRDITDGLIAHYKGNTSGSTAIDETGNHDGTITGATVTDIHTVNNKPQKTGRWIRPYHSGISVTDATPVAGTSYMALFELNETARVDQITWTNGSVTSGNLRVGIIGPVITEETSDGAPVAYDSGSIAQSGTNTVQVHTIASPYLTLQRGRYYVAIMFDNTTARFLRQSNQLMVTGWVQTYARSGGYGAFTNPSPTPTNTGSNCPGLNIRIVQES